MTKHQLFARIRDELLKRTVRLLLEQLRRDQPTESVYAILVEVVSVGCTQTGSTPLADLPLGREDGQLLPQIVDASDSTDIATQFRNACNWFSGLGYPDVAGRQFVRIVRGGGNHPDVFGFVVENST